MYPDSSPLVARRQFLIGAGCALASPLFGLRTAFAQTSPLIEAESFRLRGMSDLETLTRAFRAWDQRGTGTLALEPGRIYDLGAKRDARNIFPLSRLANAILAGNGATIRIHTLGNVIYDLFQFSNYRNIRIENLHGTDTGYRDDMQGAKFIVLAPGHSGSRGVVLDNVSAERLPCMIRAEGPPARRVSGIHIVPNCRAERVYKPFSCENQGDNVTGGYSTNNCRRSYFPYGVSDHDLDIRIHHDNPRGGLGAETCALIKTYGRATRNISVRLDFSGVLPWAARNGRTGVPGSCVTLEHEHSPRQGPSLIENIDLTINIDPRAADPFGAHRVALRSYDQNLREEIRTANVWRNIRIAGDLRPGRNAAIFSRAQPNVPGDLRIPSSLLQRIGGSIEAPGFAIEPVAA